MIEEWEDLQAVVIGYLFHKGGEVSLHQAIARLQSDYFQEYYKALWILMKRYNQETRGVLNLAQLRSYLRSKKISEEKLFTMEKLLEEAKERVEGVDEGGFLWHMGRLEEVYKEIKFVEISNKSYELLQGTNYAEAKNFLLSSLSKLEGGYLDISPDGLIDHEVEDFIREVGGARDRRAASAIDFGFPSLDSEVVGLRGGDVCLIVGWTGVGKTTLCLNVAVHASFVQKKNVVFVTTETVRAQLRRRLYSRMTKLPEFDVPVSSKSMKSGELNEGERETLLKLKPFLKEFSHGALMMTQAPARATMDWLRGKLLEYETLFKVDVLILDDIRNMTPSPKRKQDHEEISQLMKDFKRIARTHGGRGIPAISPWHTSREAYKEAKANQGEMSLAGLSSSAEAERQSDVIIFLWREEDTSAEVITSILKMRDGESGRKFSIRAEWAYQYMYEVTGGLDAIESIE